MRIMCHVGPWCLEQYREIARGVDPSAVTHMVSGFKDLDETSLVDKYYRYIEFYRNQALDVDQLFQLNEEVILRCRLLRSLTEKESVVHVLSMRRAISEVFDTYTPDVIISETIDQFLMHLLHTEATNRGIPFFGLVVTFVNGYYRFSAKGNSDYRRSVEDDEVLGVLDLLENRAYRPAFIKKSDLVYLSAPVKRWAANIARIPYFIVKKWLTGEHFNYHYWVSHVNAARENDLFPKLPFHNSDWRAFITKTEKKKIYVPLQSYPEATIEYWCESLAVIDYDKVLLRTVRRLAQQFILVIKEHPNALGLRGRAFYKQLSSIENVVVCPATENSNHIVELVDAVLVWTGSVGFEAALRGKPVLTVGDPYYAWGPSFKKINDVTPNEEIEAFFEQFAPLSDSEKFEMVAHLVSGLVPGEYKNDWSWRRSSDDDKRAASLTGRHIKRHLASNKGDRE